MAPMATFQLPSLHPSTLNRDRTGTGKRGDFFKKMALFRSSNTNEHVLRRDVGDFVKGAFSGTSAATATATATAVAQTAEEVEELLKVALRLRLVLLPQICNSTGSSWWQRAPAMGVSGGNIVQAMVSAGFVSDHPGALSLGSSLIRTGAICGTEGPTVFSPSRSSYYRFSVDRFAMLADEVEDSQLMDRTRVGGAMAGMPFRKVAELSESMRGPNAGIACTVDPAGVRGFTGKDCVDWLLNQGVVGSRETGVLIASALVREGAFSAEDEELNFVDGLGRYCFAEDRFAMALRAALSVRVKSSEKEVKFQGPATNDYADPLAFSFATVGLSERTHAMVSDSSSASSSYY